MIGFVLWCDPQSFKAIIWCEDQGELVAYNMDPGSGAEFPLAGDLVSFDLVLRGNTRIAEDLAVVQEAVGQALIQKLRSGNLPQGYKVPTEALRGRKGSEKTTSRKVIPFPGPVKRKPADEDSRRSG